MWSSSDDDCKNDLLQWWDIPAEVMQKLKHMAFEALLVLKRVVLRLLASLTMSKQHISYVGCVPDTLSTRVLILFY